MARQASAPIAATKAPSDLQPGTSAANLPFTDGEIIEVPDVTGGMIQNMPRDKIPKNSHYVIVNGRTRDDEVGRREGTDTVGTKPDSNRVIGVFDFVGEDLQRRIIRVTTAGIYLWDGDGWDTVTVTGSYLTGSRRVKATSFFNKVYLGFDTASGIWELNITNRTAARLSEAPSAKLLTTFGERVIGANLSYTDGGRFPSGVAACVNSDPADWDGEGSYFSDHGSESDIGDEITGLAALSKEVVIVKRQSIAHLTRQPFNIAPFRIDTVISGVGSDLIYTTVKTQHGIIFADSRTNDVYLYRPGNAPVSLTQQDSHIHGLLYEELGNARFAEASWDPYEGEYHLGLVWGADDDLIVRRWVCNLHRNYPVWSYDDSPTLSCLGVVLPPDDPTSINELTGTINALSGNIDGLSSRAVPRARLFAGITTGEVIEFSEEYDHDWNDNEFFFELESHNIGSISRRRILKDLELKCSIPTTGDVSASESNDRVTWTNVKSETVTGSDEYQYVRIKKQITGDDLYWKLVTSAPRFKLHSWWARVMEKGMQHGGLR